MASDVLQAWPGLALISPGGRAVTIPVKGQALVLPAVDNTKLFGHNQYVLDPGRLIIDESPWGGVKNQTDYMPGALSTPTTGAVLTDLAGGNEAQALGAGLLSSLDMLYIDETVGEQLTGSGRIIDDFIVKNNNTDNNAVTFDDCSSVSGWTVSSGTSSTFEVVSGALRLAATAANSSILIKKSIASTSTTNNYFIKFQMKYAGSNAPSSMFFRLVDSNGYKKTWSGSRFAISTSYQTYVLPYLAPAGSAGANPASVDSGFDITKLSYLEIGLAGTTGTAYECHIDNIQIDTGKAVFIEIRAPDNLKNCLFDMYCWNGTIFSFTRSCYLDPAYLIGTSNSSQLKGLDGTAYNDMYGTNNGRGFFSKGTAGQTVTGYATSFMPQTETYSTSGGTKYRVGFSLFMPPSDGGRTSINKIKLRTRVSYSTIDGRAGVASCIFAAGTEAAYGLDNLAAPWLALLDASGAAELFIFTDRPKTITARRSVSGDIYEIIIDPGNSQIFHASAWVGDFTQDGDGDYIPDCLAPDLAASLAAALAGYAFNS